MFPPDPHEWDAEGLQAELVGQDNLAGISAAFLCLARVMVNAGVPNAELWRLIQTADESSDHDWRLPVTDPYPKSKQLARGERRYRRKVASPKQWAAIRAAKLNGQKCRVCANAYAEELHHLVARDMGGDDVQANLVGLCREDHRYIEHREPQELRRLAESLTPDEAEYVFVKLGEGAMERLFGV